MRIAALHALLPAQQAQTTRTSSDTAAAKAASGPNAFQTMLKERMEDGARNRALQNQQNTEKSAQKEAQADAQADAQGDAPKNSQDQSPPSPSGTDAEGSSSAAAEAATGDQVQGTSLAAPTASKTALPLSANANGSAALKSETKAKPSSDNATSATAQTPPAANPAAPAPSFNGMQAQSPLQAQAQSAGTSSDASNSDDPAEGADEPTVGGVSAPRTQAMANPLTARYSSLRVGDPSDSTPESAGKSAFVLTQSKDADGDGPGLVAAGHDFTAPLNATPLAAGLTQTAQAPVEQAPLAGSATIATPVAADGWTGEVAKQLVVFTQQGPQSAQLHLNPLSLGPVNVHINLDGQQASVALVATHPETRQALEQNLNQLRDMFASQGVSLGSLSVDSGSTPGGQGQSAYNRIAAAGTSGETGSSAQAVVAQRLNLPTSLVDIFA